MLAKSASANLSCQWIILFLVMFNIISVAFVARPFLLQRCAVASMTRVWVEFLLFCLFALAHLLCSTICCGLADRKWEVVISEKLMVYRNYCWSSFGCLQSYKGNIYFCNSHTREHLYLFCKILLRLKGSLGLLPSEVGKCRAGIFKHGHPDAPALPYSLSCSQL